MAFNWKGLFIVDEEAERQAALQKPAEQPAKPVETPKTSFPSEQKASVQMPSTVSYSTNNEAFTEVLAVYEKGFDSLNHDGYDFFELYKSVMAVGADNPQSYQMAYAMGKSIKPDLSKSFLLEKAKIYVAEIEKVHAKYSDVGNKKKNDLVAQQSAEKSNLNSTIKNLETQIAQLQAQLSKSKSDLSEIDNKYVSPIKEMEERIGANNKAKETILNSIQKIINGINQNL
jgi:predicted RNase H-like nuclease (RuvC/YqgF family)